MQFTPRQTMTTDELAIIDKKLLELINDNTNYTFTVLREKVEEILESTDIFKNEDGIDQKAVDLYLKNVITKRNDIAKQQEKAKIDESKETKYALIEAICKKCEFNSQEELIKKIDNLEKKTNFELNELNNSM